MRERQRLEEALADVRGLGTELDDTLGLIEMAEAEGDAAMVADAEASIVALHSRAETMRLESMLSGEADANDTYLEIHAGAGGTESRIGRRCCFACIRAGRNARAISCN